ncbi:uncharacterized protein LOC127858182 [Dreissena polymorpha]|uniref:uncharacterized protein LOC127858182 n=1 Tax=Dreissena polymorpha TaxID=45954 RepID=UPI002264F52C|nr:uncharacterized protein LOC127858182 [Dreissena polymorpha]
MTSVPLPSDVLTALQESFQSKPDSLARIIFFLADHSANGFAEPYIQSLKAVVNMPSVFTKVAERMEQDTKTAEKDPHYKQMMYDIWQNFMKDDLSENPDHGQKWDLAVPGDSVSCVVQYNFMRAVSSMPPESYLALSNALQAIGNASSVVRFVDKALTKARVAKPLVRVGLVAAYLAYDVIVNIRRWWKGEISGTRCVKNIIDNGVSVAAGIAGGIGGEVIGAAVGSFLGPIGTVVGAIGGAIIGGYGSSYAAHALSDRLTQWVFGLPKSEALERGYNFLGLPPNASNSDINSRYRQLALQYHPDKGGNPNKWTQLQYSLAVIREARGEH